MRIRKQICPDFDIDKKSMLFDYKQWGDQNQKCSAFNRNLQREKEKLLRENVALKKQNQQLLIYKERYLQSVNIYRQQDSLKINMDSFGFNTARKSSVRKNQFRYSSNQKRMDVPKSARNYSQISTLIENRINQTQKRMNSRKSSAQRSRRKFNYLGEEQVWAGRVEQQKKIQEGNDDMRTFFDKFQLKEQEKEIIEKKQNQNKIKVSQEHSQESSNAVNRIHMQQSNDQSLRQQKLQQEIQQLKNIQSKLLQRLEQRGSIIQQLHSLLIISKIKSDNQHKEHDTETIDTAFSPKDYS